MKKVKTLRGYYQRAKQNELTLIAGKAVRKARTKPIYDVLREKLDAVDATNTLFMVALQDALGGSVADTLYKDQLMAQLVADMDALADGLDANCNDDPLYMIFLGLKIQQGPTQSDAEPDAPASLSAETTLTPGAVQLSYEILQPTMVTSVVFEWSEDRLTWNNGQQTTHKSRYLLTGLPSRKDIYVRCYCLATKDRKSPCTAELPVFVI